MMKGRMDPGEVPNGYVQQARTGVSTQNETPRNKGLVPGLQGYN